MSDSQFSILYVDDESLLLKATKAYLQTQGFIVDTAESGKEALEKIPKNQYDAIISDYQMPGMDGIQLLEEIRKKNPDIPFILFTGRGREEVVIEAIDNGADFYVQKGGKHAPQFKELIHKINIAIQRVRSSKALTESELRFRSLIQNSSDIIRILDKDGTIIFDSPSSFSILGYPQGSLIGTSAFDYIHPDDRDRVFSDFTDVYHETNNHIPTEYRIQKADGKYLYVESLALNLLDTPGINGIVATTHPIQNQKMAELRMQKIADDLAAANEELASQEEELRLSLIQLKEKEQALLDSEERFRSMAERSSDLIILIDNNFVAVYISPSAPAIVGYEPEELIGKPADFWAKTIFEPSCPDFLHYVQKTLNGETVSNLEIKYQRKDGSLAYASGYAVPAVHDGTVTGIQISMRDITPVKTAEIKLKRSEQRFLATTLNAGVWVWEIDPDGKFIYSSSAVEQILGYTPDELTQKIHYYDLFDPFVREEQVKDTQRLTSLNQPFTDVITLYRHKDGKPVILNTSGTPVFDDQNSWTGYCGVAQDITNQKESEERIKESEARYRLLADNVHDVIWTTDDQMKMTYISPSISDLLGYSPDEALQLSFKNLISPESYQRIIDYHYVWMEQLMDRKKVFDSSIIELEFIRKDKTRVWTEIMVRAVYSDDDIFCGLVAAARDITQRKHTERALKIANHQLSLLTSVTRHDILNKVSVIFAYLALCELEYVSPTVADYLRVIKMATEDIQSQIVFTRVYQDLGSQEPQWFVLDTLMPRSVPPVTIQYVTDLKQFSLYGDPMLEKVFFNLLDNSIRHGESVSEIRVSATDAESDLIIIWEDNGIGIPFEEKETIFERGFGENTGFGLFLVREILNLTGITIQETGVPGRGARFEIRVPKEVYRIIT
ncbi:MAG: PAS domain S-box protein [Methanomicrobiales archaeon]|nr:PAS domain S-box protein [Methanomicrobiales archaeon]